MRRRTSQNGGHHRRENGGFCPLESYLKLQNFSQTVGNWDLPNWNQWLPDPATTFDLRGSLWELIFSPRESSLDIKGKMETLLFEVFVTLLLGILCGEVSSTGEVVYAVNSGGPAHTDLNGVHYQADKLTVGTASDFGKSLAIGRVAPADQILYQTERYHFSNFGYNIPIKENGDYVLILKFCEVYFQGPRLKVGLNLGTETHG